MSFGQKHRYAWFFLYSITDLFTSITENSCKEECFEKSYSTTW